MKGPNCVLLAGALLALLPTTGCEPVRGRGNADGGGIGDEDASVGKPDASTLPPGQATVRVFDASNQPMEGVLVVFHAPNGEVTEQIYTGADGVVIATVQPDSFVTTIESNSDDQGIYHRLKTIHGVMPDDEIVIGPRVPEPSWDYLGDLLVHFGATYTGAVDYNVHLGCLREWTDDIDQEIVMQVSEDECTQGAGRFDLLFTAHAENGRPIAYSVAPNVTLDNTDPIVSPNWRTDFVTLSLQASNAPDGMVLLRPELSLVHQNLDYRIGDPVGRPISAGQGSTFDMRAPQDFASVMQARLSGVFSDSEPAAADGITMLVRNIAADATEMNIDLSTGMLPRVTDVVFRKQSDEWQVDFKVDGELPDVSALAVGMHWLDNSGDVPVDWEWTIVADPRLGPPIRLPLLPDGAVAHPELGSPQWPPPDSAEVIGQAAGLADVPPGAWPFFHQDRPFEFFDNPLPLTAPAGQQARMSIGGIFELGD